jgi:hypothetical protein
MQSPHCLCCAVQQVTAERAKSSPVKCSKLKAKYGTFGGFFFFNGRGDLVMSQIYKNVPDSALKYKLFINLNL